MFKNAIVREPARSMVHGITSASLGKPDYAVAMEQHRAYIRALEQCGVRVRIMAADETYPDSCFIEDTAVLHPQGAIITRPGAPSRQGEENAVRDILRDFYPENAIHDITAPGTLEGGDVMRAGDHFYVGLSSRTNREGFNQFAAILERWNASASLIPMRVFLHLKTGLAHLENNVLLTAGEFIQEKTFETFNRIIVPDTESYAANCIWINGTVLVPAGFPQTLEKIKQAGYPVLTLELSEFRKLDGGLSCLSLRF